MKFNFRQEPGKLRMQRNLNGEGLPLVSIITPFFNAGKYFKQTFNCVMNQTFPWFEWIVIDDGSTDERSVQILKELAGQDSRIRLEHCHNGGQSAARNKAAQMATTEILIPLDADDLIEPTYIEYIYWGLLKNPEAGWCYTDSVGFQGHEYCWEQPFSASRMKEENILVCTAGIRRQVFEEAGGYDECSRHYDEDWNLWLKLLSLGHFPVHLKGCLFWYRRTDNGALKQVQSDPMKREESRRIIEKTAHKVDTRIMAKEYPFASRPGEFEIPHSSSWNRTISTSKEKLHVMMLLPWLEMGGADLFNLQIAKYLDKNRFELSVLTTVAAENAWNQAFGEHVMDVFHLPDFLETKHYAEFISYFIRSREMDILFLSNSYYGYYLIPWLRKEFPELAIIDYVHMEEWYWRNGGYARTSGVMGDILEKTYVCNEKTRQVMINSFGRLADSVETLYIGVDHKYYDERNIEYGNTKEQLGIEDQRPVILFPCRMHPQKRPFLMLEIAKELKKRKTDIAIVAVGDGPQLVEMKNKVEEWKLTKTVYFAGMQQEMRPYYKDAAVTLICSLKEGLALTAYESLSMGRPVISSDVGGQRELIDDQVGVLIPLMQSESSEFDSREFTAAEVEQYIEAIVGILGDPARYEVMKKACRERIEKQFSVELMIRHLETIFVDLVSKNKTFFLKRNQISKELKVYPGLVKECLTLYAEVEAYENMYKNAHGADLKYELMRIANSKWGRRLIKLAFKFKLNKLLK